MRRRGWRIGRQRTQRSGVRGQAAGTGRRIAAAAATVTAAVAAMFLTSPAGAAATSVQGLDVSHHQVERGPINWPRVKAAGQRFVFVKATEGRTYTDPTFAATYAAVRAAGMIRGAYDFASPDTTAGDAVREARFFARVVGVAGGFGNPGDLPPVLDLERSGGLTSAALVAWARDFLTETERLTGRVPIIYTGPAFWRASMANSRAFARYPLWIAHYTSGTPSIPGGWRTYTFWQNTSSYRVPGISGNVDHNLFNGSAAALAALANGGGGTPGNPYRAEQVCGDGYQVVDRQALAVGGTVYLLYNASNGNNCVVTLKSTNVGRASAVSAFLEVRGKARTTDRGSFACYAGPVRAAAANTCVRWGGSAGTASYDSPFEHCG